MPKIRMMLAEFDVVDQMPSWLPTAAVPVLFGLGCTLLMVLARIPLNSLAPTAGPFALIYPVTLIATLFGRWRSGAVTLTTAFLWAWYFVLPQTWSFHFTKHSDVARLVVNLISAAIVLILAEIFRQAVRTSSAERDAELKHSALLLRELDHRTKNNFMIVGSLLDLQKRRQTSPEARAALEAASGRIHSFAAANQALYEGDVETETVSMAAYLTSLTSHVSGALFLPESVTLTCTVDDARLPRDQAVSIGVVLNEAVTNAAKHAFAPDQLGVIDVDFDVGADRWQLTVSDNGQGASAVKSPSGLGSSLMESFAARAGGLMERRLLNPGT